MTASKLPALLAISVRAGFKKINREKLSAEFMPVKLENSFTLRGSETKQYLKFTASCLNFVHWEL